MPLSSEDIRRRLPEIPGWRFDGKQLAKTVKLASFMAAMDLVQRVAQAAEQANHHPDIDIRYDTVTFGLATHSDGGVTDRDFSLAAEINRLAGSP